MFMFILKYYFIKFISLLDYIIPKSNKTISFSSFPDMSDNAFGIFIYLANNYKNKLNYIWLISRCKKKVFKKYIKNYLDGDINVKFIKKNSIKGLFYYFRAKYVFFTHGLYPGAIIPQNHYVINLWHGMPLKNIAYLDGLNYKYVPNFKYGIATSKFYQGVIAESFKKNKKDIIVSGQPRNDLLFFESNKIKNLVFRQFLKRGKKNIIWLPTYRKSNIGNIREDGKVYDFLPGISREDLLKLNDFCKENNYFILVKLHPMDVLNKKINKMEKFSNISIISNQYLDDFGINLYSVLKYSDMLVTDYSSIFIDYLLLEKPIIFFIPDIEEYKKSRGFVFKKLYIDNLPGLYAKNLAELLDTLVKTKVVVKQQGVYNDINNDFTKKLLNHIGFFDEEY